MTSLPAAPRFGQELEARLQATWDGLTEEQRLAAAWWLGARLHEHVKEPGSFRFLIYDRFGFGPDAYVPLCRAGWLQVSNACHDAHAHDELVRRLTTHGSLAQEPPEKTP